MVPQHTGKGGCRKCPCHRCAGHGDFEGRIHTDPDGFHRFAVHSSEFVDLSPIRCCVSYRNDERCVKRCAQCEDWRFRMHWGLKLVPTKWLDWTAVHGNALRTLWQGNLALQDEWLEYFAFSHQLIFFSLFMLQGLNFCFPRSSVMVNVFFHAADPIINHPQFYQKPMM